MKQVPGKLRIIGGEWRSRSIPFADFAGVRPTPDRVRETVFNWLQNSIAGARCLDLFAGSGAFGFEARSRGAAEVVLVDQDLRVIQMLQRNINQLQADHLELAWREAADYLMSGVPQAFDIVFLDPPYRDDLNLWIQRLVNSGAVASTARIYLEAARHYRLQLPAGWHLSHSKTAGQVGYHLAGRETAGR